MPRYLKFNKAIFCEKYWRSNDRHQGLLIDSEAFPDRLRFVIKDQFLILLSGCHGVFCFDLAAGPALLNEIGEIIDCYQSGERQATVPPTLGKRIGQVLQISPD